MSDMSIKFDCISNHSFTVDDAYFSVTDHWIVFIGGTRNLNLNQWAFYCNPENHHARTKAVVTLQWKVMTYGTASMLGISNVINHPF